MPRSDAEREAQEERQRQIEERGVWIKQTEQPRLDQRPEGPPEDPEPDTPRPELTSGTDEG